MKRSIIVPVYNMASDGKLNYCLDSLAAQTISDYEVITVDDASTDESFSILLEYEKKYPGKFKAVHAEVNKRQGGAKNIGLSLAKGEWIGFIDSDDWILPTMYEKLIGRAEETGADMVGCDYCLTDEHLSLRHICRGQSRPQRLRCCRYRPCLQARYRLPGTGSWSRPLPVFCQKFYRSCFSGQRRICALE